MEDNKETTGLTDGKEPIGDPPPTPENTGEPGGKPYCFLHPDTLAFRQCPVCGRHYCARCLVHYFGTYYCEKCGAEHAPQQPEATRRRDRPQRSTIIPTDSSPLPPDYDESPQARRALRLAFIGLIPLLGIVLDVLALVAAFRAFQELTEIKGLRGSRKALFATGLALVWLLAQLAAFFLVLRNVLP
jgi:hypothetical protein